MTEGIYSEILNFGEALASLARSTSKRPDAYIKLAKAICGIVFFGVPHDGMDINGLKKMVGNGLNRSLVESLSNKNSPGLTALRRDFNKLLDKLDNVEVFCFYETEMSSTPKKV